MAKTFLFYYLTEQTHGLMEGAAPTQFLQSDLIRVFQKKPLNPDI